MVPELQTGREELLDWMFLYQTKIQQMENQHVLEKDMLKHLPLSSSFLCAGIFLKKHEEHVSLPSANWRGTDRAQFYHRRNYLSTACAYISLVDINVPSNVYLCMDHALYFKPGPRFNTFKITSTSCVWCEVIYTFDDGVIIIPSTLLLCRRPILYLLGVGNLFGLVQKKKTEHLLIVGVPANKRVEGRENVYLAGHA